MVVSVKGKEIKDLTMVKLKDLTPPPSSVAYWFRLTSGPLKRLKIRHGLTATRCYNAVSSTWGSSRECYLRL